MRTVDGRDRVELNRAEAPDLGRDVGRARARGSESCSPGGQRRSGAAGRVRPSPHAYWRHRDVPGPCGDPVEPGRTAGYCARSKPPSFGGVHVAVDARCRRSRSRSPTSQSRSARCSSRIPERAVAAGPLGLELGGVLVSLRRGWRSRTERRRGSARPRTARRTSTGARARARAGRPAPTPSRRARYQRIAFDSPRCSPSSSSSVGTRRAGFLPPSTSRAVRPVDHVELDALVLDPEQREDLPHLPAVPRQLGVVEPHFPRNVPTARRLPEPRMNTGTGLSLSQ